MRTYQSAPIIEPRPASPEARLWASLIQQMFADALCRGTGDAKARDVASARRWLLLDRKSFYQVCEFAGIPASSVRCKAREFADNNWTERAAA